MEEAQPASDAEPLPEPRRWRERVLRRLYAPLAAWLASRGVRFIVNTGPQRIGHLVAEIDCFLKQVQLGERPPLRGIWLIRANRSANPCLVDYWRGHVRVVSKRWMRRLLRPFLGFPELRLPLAESVVAINDTATYFGVLARWGERPPLLRLREDHRRRGRALLREMGLPEDAWFVCVHSREGGYSPEDEHLHSYRNSDIADYLPAMDAIVERGGWCVRVGDPTMKILEPRPGVIDYANSRHKSDWMDVFLCAECRFFLGNTSGLCLVSTAFGVPSALANMIPLSNAYPFGASDLGIPKRLRRDSGEWVPFATALDDPMADFRLTHLYTERGLRVVDDTPEEIRELAIEMLDRLAGETQLSADDERLQTAFRRLFRPGHYSHGAGSRVGRDFLRRHRALLGE